MVSNYPFTINGELHAFFNQANNINQSVEWREALPFKDTMTILGVSTSLGNNKLVIQLLSEKTSGVFNICLADFVEMSKKGVIRNGEIYGIFSYTRFYGNCYGIKLQESLPDPKQNEVDSLVGERNKWGDLMYTLSKNLKHGKTSDPNYKKMMRIVYKLQKERKDKETVEEEDVGVPEEETTEEEADE